MAKGKEDRTPGSWGLGPSFPHPPRPHILIEPSNFRFAESIRAEKTCRASSRFMLEYMKSQNPSQPGARAGMLGRIPEDLPERLPERPHTGASSVSRASGRTASLPALDVPRSPASSLATSRSSRSKLCNCCPQCGKARAVAKRTVTGRPEAGRYHYHPQLGQMLGEAASQFDS